MNDKKGTHMDKIVEAILKLQPFGKLFKWLGFNDDWSALFSVILILLIVTALSKLTKFLLKRIQWGKQALEDIKPQFDHLSIKKAKQFYIQTQYQNASPARQEEPGFTHKYIARNKLIPFFIKTAFNEKADAERFYLILADSGMGKTTFMVNLYLRYNSIFTYSRNYDIKLFRFSNPDTINLVKSIQVEEARKTILLLDALDEDPGIISTAPDVSDAEAFQNRIDEIIEITKNFREVVITCRTQYFPGQEEDPYELKIKRPDEKGFYTLNKLYISPFNEKEVAKYLNKKFGIIPFINQKKKKRALTIVSKSKNLVMRPMLLSYIDYLIEDEVTNVTTYNIYDTLVAKWLIREADKRKGLAHKEKFIADLRKLSFKTAIAIYSNWRNEGRMYLSKEEALTIAKECSIQLKPEEITGQSLLTCDGVGNWKFAHKSILEFFLAKEANQNFKFLKDMNFKGMDMARKFFEELNPGLIHVDQSQNFGTNSSNELHTLPAFYIYQHPVYHYDLDELMPLKDAYYGKRNYFPQYSFKDVIDYCNKINKKYGYAPVYDETFNLLDENGKIIKHIKDVRGFRLPTRKEIHKYILNMDHSEYSRLLGIYTQKIKAAFNLKIEITDNKLEIFRPYTKEWCYDGTFVSAVLWPENNASLNEPLEPTFEMILFAKLEEKAYSFRLVFVP